MMAEVEECMDVVLACNRHHSHHYNQVGTMRLGRN
jgi:hypothetical protein